MNDPPLIIRLDDPAGRLSAFVAPELGAELCGLEWRQDGEAHELLYRGRDLSPTTGWAGRAPLLWPAIGRTFAPGFQPTNENFRDAPLAWTVDGETYPMPMHGFARSMPWTLEARSPSALRLSLSSSPHTRRHYPFAFGFTLDFSLADEVLTMTHTIRAGPENTTQMPFVLGNHATFRTPLLPHSSLDGAVVSTGATRRMELDATGRPTGRESPLGAFASPVSVSNIERFDVVALKGDDRFAWATLTDQSGLSVTVRHNVADGCVSAAPLITLWGDPGAGYLSLESWLGKPNALTSGDGLCRLRPGETLIWTLRLFVSTPGDGR